MNVVKLQPERPVPQCQAMRQPYPTAYWQELRARGRCRNYAKYEIEGVKLCKRHAQEFVFARLVDEPVTKDEGEAA